MANTVLKQTLVDGVLYADPGDPGFTVRFRNSSAKKTLNGVSVNNYVGEIIYNDDVAVTVGGVAATDAVSVRIRVSGTNEASTRKSAILTTLAAQLMTWDGQSAFKGFNPTTAPTIPV